MIHKLDSEDLINYFCDRVNHPNISMSLLALKTKNPQEIELTNQRGENLKISVSYTNGDKKNEFDEIELMFTPESTQQGRVPEQDVINFLEKLVRKDTLFKKKGVFYVPNRLQRFRKTLKEVHTQENSMLYQVINPKANPEKIKRISYNYMFRPCLYYSIHMGEFSKPN